MAILSAGSSRAADTNFPREASDRAAIEKLMWDYARALDTGDAQAYASLYTPDGSFGKIKGRDALRKMIDDLNKSRADRRAKGVVVYGTLHMTTDHYIEFSDPDHARLSYYWLTAFVPPAAAPGASSPEQRTPFTGHGIDDLVRVNGTWLIKNRDVAPRD